MDGKEWWQRRGGRGGIESAGGANGTVGAAARSTWEVNGWVGEYGPKDWAMAIAMALEISLRHGTALAGSAGRAYWHWRLLRSSISISRRGLGVEELWALGLRRQGGIRRCGLFFSQALLSYSYNFGYHFYTFIETLTGCMCTGRGMAGWLPWLTLNITHLMTCSFSNKGAVRSTQHSVRYIALSVGRHFYKASMYHILIPCRRRSSCMSLR